MLGLFHRCPLYHGPFPKDRHLACDLYQILFYSFSVLSASLMSQRPRKKNKIMLQECLFLTDLALRPPTTFTRLLQVHSMKNSLGDLVRPKLSTVKTTQPTTHHFKYQGSQMKEPQPKCSFRSIKKKTTLTWPPKRQQTMLPTSAWLVASSGETCKLKKKRH